MPLNARKLDPKTRRVYNRLALGAIILGTIAIVLALVFR